MRFPLLINADEVFGTHKITMDMLTVKCSCGTERTLASDHLVSLLGEPASMKNVGRLYDKLSCDCGRRQIEINDAQGRRLFDFRSLMPDSSLHRSLALARRRRATQQRRTSYNAGSIFAAVTEVSPLGAEALPRSNGGDAGANLAS
jgi:hypothetical protein